MSEHTKLPDIVAAMKWLDAFDSCVYSGPEWAAEHARTIKAEIERLRTSSIGWEETIEAAAKVADETAALEDKHDRYEAWRAAHDIAQTIRSLLPSAADDGLREALERARDTLPGITIDECCGDNLAIALCTYFDDAGEVDETGWSSVTGRAYTKMCDAIHEHYRAALSSGRDGGKA